MFKNIFKDENNNDRTLYACSVITGSTRVVELAGLCGFDVVWIDIEHASSTLDGAERMVIAAEAHNMIPLVRTAGYSREHILHALEIGGQIIVVPMVNDADAAGEVARHGKFTPVGRRGFNRGSRGLRFGVDCENWMERINAETWLIPQIETLEAVANIDSILAVEGIDGIFIGPGDLSTDMGISAQFENPELIENAIGCIRKAKDKGLIAGIFSGEGPLFEAAQEAGADLFIAGSDSKILKEGMLEVVERLKG
ncbi:MAG: aldolase/citrate lyase family protein [Planctomycetota bacterium]|nr:aldolase/citrate lyase family protein [Planctomycetota bacterium]MDP7253565.1 aldolase/citrate lyase family protein [Planctomycetota bacterium]